MEKEYVKMAYETPAIEDHGDVKSITLQGSLLNSDTEAGVANTAYGPPGS